MELKISQQPKCTHCLRKSDKYEKFSVYICDKCSALLEKWSAEAAKKVTITKGRTYEYDFVFEGAINNNDSIGKPVFIDVDIVNYNKIQKAIADFIFKSMLKKFNTKNATLFGLNRVIAVLSKDCEFVKSNYRDVDSINEEFFAPSTAVIAARLFLWGSGANSKIMMVIRGVKLPR